MTQLFLGIILESFWIWFVSFLEVVRILKGTPYSGVPLSVGFITAIFKFKAIL